MNHRTDLKPSSLLMALKSNTWFASCLPSFQSALVERARLRQLKAGDALFARGQAPDGLCCVLAGALRVGSPDPRDGAQRLTAYVEPYQWLGEIALIDGLPRSQDVVSDMDSTVLIVPSTSIEPWLEAHPMHWRDLARLTCGTLRLMQSHLEDQATLPLEQQLVRRLLFVATHHGQVTQAAVRRRVRMPQDYLARMLGVSRQTVNKALRVLEGDQLLALHYAEIEIIDMPGLVDRAGHIEPGLRKAALAQSTPRWSDHPG